MLVVDVIMCEHAHASTAAFSRQFIPFHVEKESP